MSVGRRVRMLLVVLLAGAAAPIVAAVASAAPTPPSIGFWAGQSVQPCLALDPLSCPRDLSAYTPDVWTALANGHGSLYLDLVYGSDFGPVPFGERRRSDALGIIRQANAYGVPVNAWITVPLSNGTFANEQNAATIKAAVEAFPAWTAQQHVQVVQPVLDLEFPLGTQAVYDALTTGDLTGVQHLMRAQIDPRAQCAAMRTDRDTIAWAHAHGMRISGSPVPFALDDLANGTLALQDALDIVAFPPFGYDQLYLQAYRAEGIDLGSGYVASYYTDMQHYFGASGQVSLGNTGTPPYDNLGPLVADVRMLAAMGASTIPIFDLEGAVKSYGASGITQILAAAGNPMSATELAAARQMSATGRAARQLFGDLDAAATALTPVVTALALHPQAPNAYPDGCGILHG